MKRRAETASVDTMSPFAIYAPVAPVDNTPVAPPAPPPEINQISRSSNPFSQTNQGGGASNPFQAQFELVTEEAPAKEEELRHSAGSATLQS